jgi:triosephosphate isomerase
METAMRSKLIVGNWKMNGDIKSNRALLNAVVQELQTYNNANYAVCVPAPYLFQARLILKNTNIAWGGQNVNQFEHGALTGAVAPHMLTDLGCTYVLIGHSERRLLFHETNTSTSASFEAAISAGITPILCIGETLAELKAGETETVLAKQIDAVMLNLNANELKRAMQLEMVFAYEPVWAVGSKNIAPPAQVQIVHEFIRRHIEKHNALAASQLRILYGGSVNSQNAGSLLAMPDVDGGLIGGASLTAKEFIAICKLANSLS